MHCKSVKLKKFAAAAARGRHRVAKVRSTAAAQRQSGRRTTEYYRIAGSLVTIRCATMPIMAPLIIPEKIRIGK